MTKCHKRLFNNLFQVKNSYQRSNMTVKLSLNFHVLVGHPVIVLRTFIQSFETLS